MEKNDLDHHINDYYSKQEIAPELLERMKDMRGLQRQSKPNFVQQVSENLAALFRRPKSLGYLAAFLLLLALPLGYQSLSINENKGLMQDIAREVALNHNKRLPADFMTGEYGQLVTMMDKLDFKLVTPQHQALKGFQLKGARYCSLQGQIAGQLKLENLEGEQQTLYVTKLSEIFSPLPVSEQTVDGLQISSWSSNGLFFSLAR